MKNMGVIPVETMATLACIFW